MCRILDSIKWLFNKEQRFLTTANGGIELGDDVLDIYGWLDLVYDRSTGILYCGMHKPYLFGNKKIKKILFDRLFRTKDDPTWDVYTINFDEDKDDFVESTDILEAMGIKKLQEKQI